MGNKISRKNRTRSKIKGVKKETKLERIECGEIGVENLDETLDENEKRRKLDEDEDRQRKRMEDIRRIEEARSNPPPVQLVVRRVPSVDEFKKGVVGQASAIDAVVGAISQHELGWSDGNHPLVLYFAGSSGVGKTELAKQVALYVNGDAEAGLIRFDMGGFKHEHEVSKFIGAPPGYIGFTDGGQLTNQLLRFQKNNMRAVVLLDEIEKAHPEIMTTLLQLFDEGRLSDGQGKTIQVKNSIFIMTSNLAAAEIANYGTRFREAAALAGDPEQKLAISENFKSTVRAILLAHFKRDEFLGRITEIIYFLPFSHSELIKLASIEMESVKRKATEKRIVLDWGESVVGYFADNYVVAEGARSIQKQVTSCVRATLANAENSGILSGCSALTINCKKKLEKSMDTTMVFEVVKPENSFVIELPVTCVFKQTNGAVVRQSSSGQKPNMLLIIFAFLFTFANFFYAFQVWFYLSLG